MSYGVLIEEYELRILEDDLENLSIRVETTAVTFLEDLEPCCFHSVRFSRPNPIMALFFTKYKELVPRPLREEITTNKRQLFARNISHVLSQVSLQVPVAEDQLRTLRQSRNEPVSEDLDSHKPFVGHLSSDRKVDIEAMRKVRTARLKTVRHHSMRRTCRLYVWVSFKHVEVSAVLNVQRRRKLQITMIMSSSVTMRFRSNQKDLRTQNIETFEEDIERKRTLGVSQEELFGLYPEISLRHLVLRYLF